LVPVPLLQPLLLPLPISIPACLYGLAHLHLNLYISAVTDVELMSGMQIRYNFRVRL
jgi:hypothetical protein